MNLAVAWLVLSIIAAGRVRTSVRGGVSLGVIFAWSAATVVMVGLFVGPLL